MERPKGGGINNLLVIQAHGSKMAWVCTAASETGTANFTEDIIYQKLSIYIEIHPV